MNRNLMYIQRSHAYEPKQFHEIGSDAEKKVDYSDSNSNKVLCNCNRSVEQVKCGQCKYVYQGRRRLGCPVHPNVIHLMDQSVCPVCKRAL